MTKYIYLIVFFFVFAIPSKGMSIKYFGKFEISAELLTQDKLRSIKSSTTWQVKNDLPKQSAARTILLEDGRVIQEFFDKQGLLYKSLNDFQKASGVKYIKSRISFLRPRVSYVFELEEKEGKALIEKGILLPKYQSKHPNIFSIEVYRLENLQVVYVYKEGNSDNRKILLYEDLHALAIDQYHIYQAQYPEGAETGKDEFIQGYISEIFNHEEYYISKEEYRSLLENHSLQVVDREIPYRAGGYFNLYRSKTDNLFLIQDFERINEHTKKPIRNGEVYFFESRKEYEEKYQLYLIAKQEYENTPNASSGQSIYKKLSDSYGENFPANVNQEIKHLYSLLNLEGYSLKFDQKSVNLIDEAILWNCMNVNFLDQIYTPLLAYIGQYMVENEMGNWNMEYDDFLKTWNPQVLNTEKRNILPGIDIFDALNESQFRTLQIKYYFQYE